MCIVFAVVTSICSSNSNYNKLFFDNRIKWYAARWKQIRIVSKFVPGNRPSYTFWNSEIEIILHLFSDFNNKSQFLNLVFKNFSEFWQEIQGLPSRNAFIFGIKGQKYSHKRVYCKSKTMEHFLIIMVKSSCTSSKVYFDIILKKKLFKLFLCV